MRFLSIFLGIFLISVEMVGGQEISFNRQIRPLLSRNCIACHGPDEAHRQADLRLDTRDGALMALEPGDPDSSELVYRIQSDDEADQMPPPEHGSRLSPDEIDLIVRWIKEGAQYEEHWAFVVPKKVSPPPLADPMTTRPKNEIDFFVAERLTAENLKLMPQADPRRLVRRLALDLTGLPPNPEMVEPFARAPTDENYESIVDQLLASESYGEHWAAMWLDLARYADTIGYAEDRHRDIWPWRDWVIRSFNQNQPFDQFTLEQIAGDLLPDASPDQVLATAFHRNTLNNTEGGTNNEEFRTIAVKDRLSTTLNVWMGLTVRCAECHTHKYDPISQTEYYQFLDFFNQTADADRNDDEPKLDVRPQGRESEIAKLNRNIENLQSKLSPETWKSLVPKQAVSTGGATMEILDDLSIRASGHNPSFDEYTLRFELPAEPITGIRLEVIPDGENGGNVGRHKNGSFVLTQLAAELESPAENYEPIGFSGVVADHTQANHQVESLIENSTTQQGWAVGHPRDGYKVPRVVVFELEKPVDREQQILNIRLNQNSKWEHANLARMRIAVTTQKDVIERARKRFQKQKKIRALERQRDQAIRVPVMKELPEEKRRQTHVMIRGSFLQPGAPVSAAVFSAFHPLPEDAPTNRLGVAQWIVHADNPLTARVTVNRFWARLFGRGIVESEEDFGTQGIPPSHPRLLDWLAVDFREHQWDVKRLLKQMVMSATYRQSSRATSENLERDPRNVLLSRGPRHRLRAEVIRDQALAVSGLLSAKKYGPPVYPPNPVRKVRSAFQGETVWHESQGEDRFRRAIYTYLKRTAPHPLFETFDVSTREVCSLRRIRTNTPLQSFMTLNDQAFLEAAQALAQKMWQAGPDASARIERGYELALLRSADPTQLNVLEDLYHVSFDKYLKAPDDARTASGASKELDETKAAELASLTVVSNVILNLDAFLTK